MNLDLEILGDEPATVQYEAAEAQLIGTQQLRTRARQAMGELSLPQPALGPQTWRELDAVGAELLSVNPALANAIGPRPTGDAVSWDLAVTAAAVYEARWGAGLSELGLPNPAIAGDERLQWDHYDALQPALKAADRAQFQGVVITTLGRLRTDVEAPIGDRPDRETTRDAYREATNELRHLDDRINRSSGQRERHASTWWSRITNFDRIIELDHEIDADNAARPELVGKAMAAASAAQLAAVDRSYDRRINAAVAKPAEYLTQVLGPQPIAGPEATTWTEAATAIESFRHRQAGLSPQDGPQAQRGPQVALGPQPAAGPTRERWLSAKALVTSHRNPTEGLTRSAEHESAPQRNGQTIT